MKKTLVVLTAFALSTAWMGTAMASEASEAHMSSAPGVIASAGMGSCNALASDSHKWDITPLANKLSTDGVKFSSISTFGNCFQVAALGPEGHATIQLYDPTTLNRVM